MYAKILITGVAVAVLAAGAAAAQTTPSSASTSSTSSSSQTDAAAMGDTGSAAMASPKTTTPRHTATHARRARDARGGTYAAPAQPIPYAQLDTYMKSTPRERAAMSHGAATGGAADASATASNGMDNGGSIAGAPPSNDPNAPMIPDRTGPGAMGTNPPVTGATTGSASQVPTEGQGHNGSDVAGPAAGTPNQTSGPNAPQ
jgi:hypothetical protein